MAPFSPTSSNCARRVGAEHRREGRAQPRSSAQASLARPALPADQHDAARDRARALSLDNTVTTTPQHLFQLGGGRAIAPSAVRAHGSWLVQPRAPTSPKRASNGHAGANHRIPAVAAHRVGRRMIAWPQRRACTAHKEKGPARSIPGLSAFPRWCRAEKRRDRAPRFARGSVRAVRRPCADRARGSKTD